MTTLSQIRAIASTIPASDYAWFGFIFAAGYVVAAGVALLSGATA